ncbi:hypothetical protein C8R44DRAFT_734043 [Mycena epipterygia]|nr:hypothetical protein C8R44DRAFT_734043 [Mycena epipterygia]
MSLVEKACGLLNGFPSPQGQIPSWNRVWRAISIGSIKFILGWMAAVKWFKYQKMQLSQSSVSDVTKLPAGKKLKNARSKRGLPSYHLGAEGDSIEDICQNSLATREPTYYYFAYSFLWSKERFRRQFGNFPATKVWECHYKLTQHQTLTKRHRPRDPTATNHRLTGVLLDHDLLSRMGLHIQLNKRNANVI